jgi:hypothetical protein
MRNFIHVHLGVMKGNIIHNIWYEPECRTSHHMFLNPASRTKDGMTARTP